MKYGQIRYVLISADPVILQLRSKLNLNNSVCKQITLNVVTITPFSAEMIQLPPTFDLVNSLPIDRKMLVCSFFFKMFTYAIAFGLL